MKTLSALLFAAAVSLAATQSLAAATKTVTLAVQNMTCAGCAIAVRTALRRVDGVAETKVDPDGHTARVSFDPDKTNVEALTRATAAVGFPSALKE
jgi:periplasmic mercuric ion binding protein